MRNLLAATCLTPVLAAAVALPAFADTTISASTSTPIRTSTANNGAPDNVIVTSAATLTPSSGAAITIDSNNTVSNAGAITINDKNDVTGIAASTGLTSAITNSGTIALGETTTDTTTNSTTGAIDGPFAVTTNKSGIHVSGSGTFTGPISNSGAITVIGNASSGIAVDGTLKGAFSDSGSVTLTGDNGTAVHLHAVDGAVTVAGAVSAQGKNDVGLAIDGNVSGLIAIESAVQSTGYRSTTPPSDLTILNADDLLQGGPAVSIAGNAAGGVLLEAAPVASTDSSGTTDPNADTDGDGIADANEGTAAVTSNGAAPAVRIGSSTQAIALGVVKGSNQGLVIRGSAGGNGIYAGVDATGVQIGGLGGAVTIAGGVNVSGSVTASVNGGNATALRFGSGSATPLLINSGTISANGSTGTDKAIRGIEIDAGASLPRIDNSGAIFGSLANTATGTAAGIRDASGTLATINNTGTIYGILTNSAAVSATSGYALDLATNTSGITYTQSLSAATGASEPILAGRIVTGSGDDHFVVSSGSVTGNASLGAGADSLALSKDGAWVGNVDFGSGAASVALSGTSSMTGDLSFGDGPATLTLSDTATYEGNLAPGSGGLAVDVAGGVLAVHNIGAVPLSTLNVGAGGELAVVVDPKTNSVGHLVVAGTASFASGSKFGVGLTTLLPSSQTYTVLTAGNLVGAGNLAVDQAALPFLYAGSLSTSGNSISLTLDRKSADALGLDSAGAQEFDAAYAAIGNDANLTGVFLGIADQASFVSTYNQLLPDHSGGGFQSIMLGSQAIARAAADETGLRQQIGTGPLAVWVQESAWHESKDFGTADYYKIDGNGFTAGVESALSVAGTVGVAGSYIVNDVRDGPNGDKQFGYQYEGMVYWRGGFGPLHANAHASYAAIQFKSRREFEATLNGNDIDYLNNDKYHGNLFTAGGGVDYRAAFGGGFDLRPSGRIDYYTLREGSHAEQGDAATALTYDKRKSDELVATGSATLGFGIGKEGAATGWTRFELEGGYRKIVGGSLGDTSAHFTGGDDFTISGDKLKSGFIARVRATGGNASLRIGGEVSGEQVQGTVAVAARATLRLAF